MYLLFDFKLKPLQPASDILIAELSEIGFESFVETDDGLQAFIREADWQEGMFNGLGILARPGFDIRFSRTRLPQQNWNEAWEKSFNPINIGQDCVVRAPFHEKPIVPYDIVIEPKMSFGTGHHETTHLMLEWLLEMDLRGKSVLDMGCGTGVLAILASMKGAAAIDAIDIDSWSYTNTLENISRNQQSRIKAYMGDAALLQASRYDIILANINRNILLSDIPRYADSLTTKGILLVSGFYLEDLPAISGKCGQVNLKFEKNEVINNWVCAKYVF